MTVIGITGPTGSGKTTALRELEKRGYETIDCDRLYNSLLERDKALRQALTDAFGPVFLPDGKLDRQALAARVFGDSRELEKLNAAVYPAVCGAVKEKIRKCSRKGVAIDAINLVESGLGGLCDLTIAVTADPAIRLQRIMARDGISRERAQERITAQKPDRFYRTHCTFLLENRAGSRAEFGTLMGQFLDTILFDDMEE